MEPDPDPLEEAAFLARSENRIEVLSALVERPLTRRELGAELAASQPTLGRVLNDLADRNWVAYDGERYAATATGELVEGGITDLRERLATEARLRDVVAYLPTGTFDFDLRHLGGATVTTPTATRPNAPVERMLELLRETDEARLLSHAFNGSKLGLLADRAGEMRVRGVFEQGAIDAVAADPTLKARLRTLLDAEGVEIRVTDEPVPAAVEVTDRRTHLLCRDEEGVVRAAVDTDDETVRAWAEALHERYWTDADPLSAADLD